MAKKPATNLLDEIRGHEQKTGYTCQTCKLSKDILDAVNEAKRLWKAGELSHTTKQAIVRWAKDRGYPYGETALFGHFAHE